MVMENLAILTFFLLLCGGTLSQKGKYTHGSNPIVETTHGKLEGTRDETRSGHEISKFMGIQYAVINERFTPSVPVSSWNGTKPAKNAGPSCEKVENHRNENCLYLNVHTHYNGESKTSSLHPVLVYFHGGSFQYNSGDFYGHRYLLDEDVVLVTVNYRLGVLGFLSTKSDASPGNYGLKDQVMALRWIQQNIEAFGGDKDRVTIMGQSAGSASVTYHLVSPMSKGLFHNAIAQSGTFLDPWAFTRSPMRFTRKLAKHLECPDLNSSSEIVNCLRSLPVESIANYDVNREVSREFFRDPLAAFGPVVESSSHGQEVFLPQSPYEILVAGNGSAVPLLTGVTDAEGGFLWAVPLLFFQDDLHVNGRTMFQMNFTGVAPIAFYFNETTDPPERRQEVAEKIREYYFQDESFDLNNLNQTLNRMVKLYTDRLFTVSHTRFANLYAKYAPTYPYLYTFRKFPGFESQINQSIHDEYNLGAAHAADLDVLFSPLFDKLNPNAEDPEFESLSKSVVKLWVSFISEGKPTATYGSENTFPPLDPDQGLQKFYRIDTNTSLVPNPFAGSIEFWDSLNLSDTDFMNVENDGVFEDSKNEKVSE